MYREFFGKILNDIKLFKFNFSYEFLDAISLYMKEGLFGPGEVIYLRG